jgi:hypothetical protein
MEIITSSQPTSFIQPEAPLNNNDDLFKDFGPIFYPVTDLQAITETSVWTAPPETKEEINPSVLLAEPLLPPIPSVQQEEEKPMPPLIKEDPIFEEPSTPKKDQPIDDNNDKKRKRDKVEEEITLEKKQKTQDEEVEEVEIIEEVEEPLPEKVCERLVMCGAPVKGFRNVILTHPLVPFKNWNGRPYTHNGWRAETHLVKKGDSVLVFFGTLEKGKGYAALFATLGDKVTPSPEELSAFHKAMTDGEKLTKAFVNNDFTAEKQESSLTFFELEDIRSLDDLSNKQLASAFLEKRVLKPGHSALLRLYLDDKHFVNMKNTPLLQ